MDQNSVIALAVVILSFFAFTYISMQEVFKFRLKKEQIKADALVKSEEIKAKNQLEIEALYQRDSSINHRHSYTETQSVSEQEQYLNDRRGRLDERA